jgi:hypothetical protein
MSDNYEKINSHINSPLNGEDYDDDNHIYSQGMIKLYNSRLQIVDGNILLIVPVNGYEIRDNIPGRVTYQMTINIGTYKCTQKGSGSRYSRFSEYSVNLMFFNCDVNRTNTLDCQGDKCRNDVTFEDDGVWCVSCRGEYIHDTEEEILDFLRENLKYSFSFTEISKETILAIDDIAWVVLDFDDIPVDVESRLLA